ncbi:MAG: hypothetical protein GSR81_02520 [Desulfurococcales archaeon]|nr:hypothetical protein [Desulfurococcales archaeon]
MIHPYIVNPELFIERRLGVKVPLPMVLEEDDSLTLVEKLLSSLVENRQLELPSNEYEAVISYYGALVASAKSRAYRLIKLLIDASVDHALSTLPRVNDEELIKIAKNLGIELEYKPLSIPWLVDPAGRVVPKILKFRIDLIKYLETIEGSNDAVLSLPSGFVKSRKIYLDRQRAIHLIIHGIRRKLESLIDEYKGLEAPRLEELGRRYARELVKRSSPGIRPNLYPECIQSIMDLAKKGGLSDEEIYVLITFIANLDPPVEYVEDMLNELNLASTSALPNIARAIVEIASRYTPYKCGSSVLREICGECSEDLLKTYYKRVRSIRRRKRQ